jgi:hypothetical protein
MEISEELLAAMRVAMRGMAEANARAIAVAKAVLGTLGPEDLGPPRDELIVRSPCQVLVENLFAEARVFHGSVPSVSRQAWVEAIEACKGKIPEAEYNAALAILRVGS